MAFIRSLLSVLTVLVINLAVPSVDTAAEAADPPRIALPELEFDLGKVNEGMEFRHTFKIRNEGGSTLVIKTAFSTCGCTVPTIKRKEIPPAEEGDLEVLLDTSLKQGDISKPIEIRTNDPVNPVSTIYIKAKVTSPHADLSDAKAKIFTGRCAACHVTKGIGKQGEELYQADCAMCHGFRALGIPGVAPGLVPKDYSDAAVCDAARQIISHGSPSHRSMPGYLDKSGGPLSEKEIESLMKFLKKRSTDVEKERQKFPGRAASQDPRAEIPDEENAEPAKSPR